MTENCLSPISCNGGLESTDVAGCGPRMLQHRISVHFGRFGQLQRCGILELEHLLLVDSRISMDGRRHELAELFLR